MGDGRPISVAWVAAGLGFLGLGWPVLLGEAEGFSGGTMGWLFGGWVVLIGVIGWLVGARQEGK